MPLGLQSRRLVAPYLEQFVPPEECLSKCNRLNAPAFQNGKYPITHRLFAIVKQNGQLDEQAGVAYAQLLLSDQGQEFIEKAGFLRIH